MIRRIAMTGCGALLVAATLSGCRSPVESPSAASSTTPGGSPSPIAAASSQPTVGPGGSTTSGGSPGQPADCTAAHLEITLAQGGSGSGHRSAVLTFRNTGSGTCQLYGYPGVAGLDAHGAQLEQAARTTSGYLGGLRGTTMAVVNLSAGQSASATVEALAFRPDGSSCSGYAALLVTPPNETHAVRLAWNTDACSDLQIHPVVAN